MAGFLARIVGGLIRDRTLQAGTGITITNPAGDAGDPTISATNAGTVTHTTGALTNHNIAIGTGGADIKPLGDIGTATKVLHGNATPGDPFFAQVDLAADVIGTLPGANLPGNVAYTNVNNGMVAQTWATGNVIDGVNPAEYWHDTAAAANQKYWRLIESAGSFYNQALDDTLIAQASFALDRGCNIGLFGGQIVFPATQNASSNANALDDYEEGTWTPHLEFGGSTAGQGYNIQTGYYTKVGNVVFCSVRIQFNNKGIAAGTATITGWPFADITGVANGGSCIYYANFAAGMASFPAFYINSVTAQLIYEAAGTIANMANTDCTNTSDLIAFLIIHAAT